ncbi:MAG: DUF1028 domain-containing protein [Flavobacteriia bacterium]|nr:DUF1028 domain-containing protein [Flavobacteriia bacterium]
MKHVYLLTLLSLFTVPLTAQDTFSIVAVDPRTGEIGAAGASCVDLFQFDIDRADFLSQIVPGIGAVNTQAYYNPENQELANRFLKMGLAPDQIITELESNDVEDRPYFRQYGVVTLTNTTAKAWAYTGDSTNAYTGHIIGPGYAIQGNILSGSAVLDSMEARFVRTEGDLATRLMAAMQGANVVGADSRCAPNGTSSLFAFLKVAQPEDEEGMPSTLINVMTHDGDRKEPIDLLQRQFDQMRAVQVRP